MPRSQLSRPWDDSAVAMKDKLKANHGQLQQQLLDEKATVVKLVNDVSRLMEELAVQECHLEEMKRAHARDQQELKDRKLAGAKPLRSRLRLCERNYEATHRPGTKATYLTSGAVISTVTRDGGMAWNGMPSGMPLARCQPCHLSSGKIPWHVIHHVI